MKGIDKICQCGERRFVSYNQNKQFSVLEMTSSGLISDKTLHTINILPNDTVLDLTSTDNLLVIICNNEAIVVECTNWNSNNNTINDLVVRRVTEDYEKPNQYYLTRSTLFLVNGTELRRWKFLDHNSKIEKLKMEFENPILTLTPDGIKVLVQSTNGIQICGIEEKNPQRTPTYFQPITCITWSSNKYLVVGYDDGLMQIFDYSQNLKIVATFHLHDSISAISVNLDASNNVSRILVGTENGQLWNFKVLDLHKELFELFWVSGPLLTAHKANLNNVKNCSNLNKKLLEQKGAKE